MPEGSWELRKYLLQTAYHWNKDLLLINKQVVMPKEMLLDVFSVVKASSTAFNNRLDINCY